MRISPDQLSPHLQKGLKNLYSVYGSEPLLVAEALDAIRASARQAGFTERSSYTIDTLNFDWSQVLGACNSPGLFADKQIIELHIKRSDPGKKGGLALQQMTKLLAHNHATLVLIELPQLDKKTKASDWFGALDAGVSVAINPVARANLPQWIAQRLSLQQQRVSSGEPGQRALQFFADCVEGNLLAAHQEIQKLALLYPSGELSLEQIQSAIVDVARFDLYKLPEVALSGQFRRLQRMLDGLHSEGEEAVRVHATLARDIRALKSVKDAMQHGQPLPMALNAQRIWGDKERLFERALPRLSQKILVQLLQDAHQVDGVIKGLAHPDWPSTPWQALNKLALRLCALCANPSTATSAAGQHAKIRP